MRGVRQRSLPPELVVRRPGVSLPPPVKLPSKRWRDLVLRSSLQPAGSRGPYTYEPCDDVDPAPDYENALTD